MDISVFLKSLADSDAAPIVICDKEHNIVYMNPTADEHYKKWGGAELVGKSIFSCHNSHSIEKIKKVVEWFGENPQNNKIYTYHNPTQNKDVYMIALRNENGELIGYYEKHEYRNAETTKLYDFLKKHESP